MTFKWKLLPAIDAELHLFVNLPVRGNMGHNLPRSVPRPQYPSMVNCFGSCGLAVHLR